MKKSFSNAFIENVPDQPSCEPDSIEDELLDAGVPPHCLAAVQAVFDVRATELAGIALRKIVLSVRDRTASVALQRALLGEHRSLIADATALGISRQTLHRATQRQVARLREKIG